MNRETRKNAAKTRRIARVRVKVKGTSERPRLTVRRSLSHIYAQVVDDASGRTIVAASDADVKAKDLKKTEMAAAVGKLVAERAIEKKIEAVVFDRRDKRYHGRVKALADAARAAGLRF